MPQSNAKVTGDFTGLIQGAESAAKSLTKLAATATGISALSKSFDAVTGAAGALVNGLGKIGLAAQGLEAIGKSAVAMGMGLLKGNAALEMTQISFKTLLGSAQAADQMIKDLTTFAANTPFNLPGLEQATQRLLGAGYAARDIVPMMTALGDSIAALGGTQDQLNSLVYVFGQMRNEAHLNAGDIMQMSNLGIPALQMLADHYKVTTAQIQEMISKGLIPGKEAAAIFATEMERRYGGMMVAQSKTFSGMISNLQDWAGATMIILTKPFFEPAKKALQALLDFVQSPAGVAAIAKLAGYIQEGVDKMTAAFVRFEPKIKPTFERLLQLANAIRLQMTPGILTLIPLLEKAWARFEPLGVSIWKAYQAIQPMNIAFAALRGLLEGGVAGALDALKGRFSLIAGYVKTAFDFALTEAKKFGPQLLSWVAETAILLANKAVTWGQALIVWVAPYAVKLVDALIALAGRVVVWVVGYAPVLAKQLLKWTDALASWVIPAIPLIVKSLEQVGAAIVNWGVTRLPQIMAEIAIGIGDGFGVNLRAPVSDVLKIFNSLVYSIKNTVLPAFLQMTRFLSTEAMPVIDRLANFIARTLIPTIASLAAFMMTTVVPIFVRAADLFGLVFGPALTLIGSIIRNELLPALTDSWKYFDEKYMPTVRDLASALGDKLAEGIRIATDKFKDAIPKLEDFFKKIEPIVDKALDLYKAISPISIALDVLKGFLEGGLQGGFGALEQHVVDLGKVFGVDLQPVIDWFNNTVVKDVIPTLKEWARVFIEDWWPKIRDAVVFVWDKLSDFWTFVSTKIWPPFSEFLKWLGEQWDKVAKGIADTWENTLKPALTTFGDYLVNDLWPKLRDDVFPWIDKNIRPKLEQAFDIIGKHIIPDIGTLVDIILNKVIPTLVAWWGVLFTLINPFLKTAGDLVGALTGGLKDQKDPLAKVFDGFKTLADFMKDHVFPILDKVAGGFHTLWFLMGGWVLDPVFKSIGNIMGLIGSLGEMLDAFSKGDYLKVLQVVARVKVIFDNKQIISGNGVPPPSAGQAALDKYMKDHPDYDPVAAGNAHANGTMSAPRGLSLVGERGMELILGAQNQLLLATRPMLLNLKGGERVFNNQETMGMFRSMPASPAQIHNMYQNSNASSWDNSTHNNSNSYNLNVQQLPAGFKMSEGMQRVWYSKS